MPQAEIKTITANEGSQEITSLSIGDPRVYTKADIIDAKGEKVLPVELASSPFNLPIMSPIPEVKFAWLDPSEAGRKWSCAIEVSIMLADKMKDTKKAIVIEAPSDKSGPMVELGAQFAVNISGGEILVIKAGGGVINNKEANKDQLKDYFSENECRSLRLVQLEVGQKTEAMRMENLAGEETWVIRYKPITGKEKFMFLTAMQYDQINTALQSGAVLVTIEDVITTGTTVSVGKDLLAAGKIDGDLAIIAVAREGEKYQGDCSFAIQIPELE